MKSAQWFLAAFILSCSLFETHHSVASAAEPAPSAAKAPSTSPEAKQDGEKTEFYVSVYLQGSRPLNRPVRLQEDPFANTDVQGGLGGFARDLNLQHSTIGTVHENAADGAFAYQFLGGVRANVTERMFLFTEYKYFVANYQWESEVANGARGPSFTMNYRAHIISGGIGFTF